MGQEFFLASFLIPKTQDREHCLACVEETNITEHLAPGPLNEWPHTVLTRGHGSPFYSQSQASLSSVSMHSHQLLDLHMTFLDIGDSVPNISDQSQAIHMEQFVIGPRRAKATTDQAAPGLKNTPSLNLGIPKVRNRVGL